MEMRSEKSGFKEVLPDGVCCLPCLSVEHCAVLWETLNKEQQEGNHKYSLMATLS